MSFPKPQRWMIELFERIVAEVPGAVPRKMFGSSCAFARGGMAAGVFGEEIFVRLPEAEREKKLAAGWSLFDPMGGRPMKEYVVVPGELLDDEEAVQELVAAAVAHVDALPPKAKRAAGAKKAAPTRKAEAVKEGPAVKKAPTAKKASRRR